MTDRQVALGALRLADATSHHAKRLKAHAKDSARRQLLPPRLKFARGRALGANSIYTAAASGSFGTSAAAGT